MTCRVDYLAEFGQRQNLSYDWPLYGDLKGLQRMRARADGPAILTAADIVRLYAELSVEQRRSVSAMMVKQVPAPIDQEA